MIYQVLLTEKALRQLNGLAEAARDDLSRVLSLVVEDPYDVLNSLPRGEDPDVRWTIFGSGDEGFVEFYVDDAAQLIHINNVIWIG